MGAVADKCRKLLHQLFKEEITVDELRKEVQEQLELELDK